MWDFQVTRSELLNQMVSDTFLHFILNLKIPTLTFWGSKGNKNLLLFCWAEEDQSNALRSSQLDLAVLLVLLLLVQHQLGSTAVPSQCDNFHEGHSGSFVMTVTSAISATIWAAVSALRVHDSSVLLLMERQISIHCPRLHSAPSLWWRWRLVTDGLHYSVLMSWAVAVRSNG